MLCARAPLFLACAILAAGEASPGHVSAQLILPGSAPAGTAVDIAVELRIEAGWHLYWQNPGDSGLPPSLRWTLPPGWRADPPRFPAPERHAESGMVTFIHHQRLVLLSTLHIPARAEGVQPLRVTVGWLACKETCVPGKADLAAEFHIGGDTPADPAAADLIAAARAALPAPDASVTAVRDEAGVRLHLPGQTAAPVVFPAVEGLFRSDHPAAEAAAGGWIVHLPLVAGAALPERFIGVVRHDGRAIAIDTPIPQSTP